jgi:hypothetical protein
MPQNGTLAAELRELDEMMEKHHGKLRKVLDTLKDGISGLPVKDPRSLKEIETHLRLIDLSIEEIDREHVKYREWLDHPSRNCGGISEETLGRLREYKRSMNSETDEEMIEELLRTIDVKSR